MRSLRWTEEVFIRHVCLSDYFLPSLGILFYIVKINFEVPGISVSKGTIALVEDPGLFIISMSSCTKLPMTPAQLQGSQWPLLTSNRLLCASATHTNSQTYVCTHKINASLYKFNNYAYSHPVKEIDAKKGEGLRSRLYYCKGQKPESQL